LIGIDGMRVSTIRTCDIKLTVLDSNQRMIAKMNGGVIEMNESIVVIYEGGVLRPLQPLALPEHSRLEVQIVRRRRPSGDQRKLAYDALQAAGIIGAQLPVEDLPLISEAQLVAAAHDLAVAGPLSELIIAEREGR
jgi:predicted DNA-binding antitoxin AbrB/MazE fold protein